MVARSLGCQCDTEMPTGRTLTDSETWECGNPLRLLPLRVRVGYSGDYLGYSGDYPATRATTRLLPVRAVRERPLGSLPPLGICVPEPELTRTTAIMISFKLGKRQNRGSRAPIMVDRVSLRSARVLLCLALIPRRLMCDLHVICKTWTDTQPQYQAITIYTCQGHFISRVLPLLGYSCRCVAAYFL